MRKAPGGRLGRMGVDWFRMSNQVVDFVGETSDRLLMKTSNRLVPFLFLVEYLLVRYINLIRNIIILNVLYNYVKLCKYKLYA